VDGPVRALLGDSSLRQDVFAILDGEQDSRTVVEPVAIFLGKVIDALAGGDVALAD